MKYAAILAVLVLTACAPAPHKTRQAVYNGAHVKEFKVQRDDGFIYWYILTSTLNNSSSVYYYSSTSPITSYSSINFTRATGNKLPEEAVEAENQGQEVQEQNLTQQELPQDVETDVSTQESAYSEYSESQGQIDSQTGATEAPATSEAPSSDSGGGGGGGGGDSGGGGSD